MISIAFVMGSASLPIPAVKGGAIETLMTMLLEQNEEAGKFRFIFIYPDDVDSVQEWKYAKCYTCSIKKNQFPPMISYPQEIKGQDIWEAYPYDFKANLIAQYENVDYVIMEGVALRIRHCFENCVPKARRAVHLHHQFERKGVYEEAFGITIAPSRFIAQHWNKTDVENERCTYIVPNGIRVERFQEDISEDRRLAIRAELGFSESDFVVLFCGRLIEVKGVNELVEAVLSIRDPAVKLLLVGSDSFADGNLGGYAKKILDIVAKNPERLKYLGYIDNQHLSEYYHCADMQAVPSLWEEAVGLVALEGMCSTLPLVVTNSGGMVEYVPDGGGIVIDKEGDVTSRLAEAIIWMKEHPKERRSMAELASDTAKTYSAEKYYKDFCDMMVWWEKQSGAGEEKGDSECL